MPDKNAAAQRVMANAKLFRDMGYDILLVGLSKNTDDINVKMDYDGICFINLRYPQNMIQWTNHLVSNKQYKIILKKYKPHLIIAYNYPSIALQRLITYGKKHNIEVISDCTEWYQARGNFFYNLLKNADTYYRMKRVQPKMNAMIVISKYLENYYSSFGIKTLLLPPLVDKKDQKWQEALSYRVESNQIRLFYAGTASKKDRLDIIINTLKQIVTTNKRDLVFNIVGATKDEFLALYPSFGTIPPFVFFWGRLPHKQVLNMLASHDYQIFIREESRVNMAGFPTKFVEAISSDVLVLTNLTSDLKYYMKNGINGFSLEIGKMTVLEESLSRALLVPRDIINRMKKNLDTNQFDYRNYLTSTVNQFMDSVVK